MTFLVPSAWLLLLLLLLPLVWWRWFRGRRRALTFSSLDAMRGAGTTWRVRARWVVPALRSAALALLIVCVARPLKGDERTRVITEGIAIQLIIDRSGSMLAPDFELDGAPATRLDAVKRVVEEFAVGGDELPGRPDDLLGLITFATYADGACPMTLDHAHLARAVRQTEVAESEEDRATAIGDAIALGVERMQSLDRRSDLAGGVESRVMILLTDGESNAGDIEPLTAADMAAAFDIRIYTIGAGATRSAAPTPARDPFSGRRITRMYPVSIDEETLREIADRTGGAYFRATDRGSLEAIYGQIDELERTEVEQRRYSEHADMAVQSVRLGGRTVPPLLAVVFVLLAAELLLGHTLFRKLP